MRQSILIGAIFGFILNFHSSYNPLELNKILDMTHRVTSQAEYIEQESKLSSYSLVLNSTISEEK